MKETRLGIDHGGRKALAELIWFFLWEGQSKPGLSHRMCPTDTLVRVGDDAFLENALLVEGNRSSAPGWAATPPALVGGGSCPPRPWSQLCLLLSLFAWSLWVTLEARWRLHCYFLDAKRIRVPLRRDFMFLIDVKLVHSRVELRGNAVIRHLYALQSDHIQEPIDHLPPQNAPLHPRHGPPSRPLYLQACFRLFGHFWFCL